MAIYVLVLIASASFYFQAIVTEERFVPALNVISKRLKISDDVAGATIMAAGSSSPELFAVIISIFVTHSALGIGTVVGSEVRVLRVLVGYYLKRFLDMLLTLFLIPVFQDFQSARYHRCCNLCVEESEIGIGSSAYYARCDILCVILALLLQRPN